MKIYFTDRRDLLCGDLQWRSADMSLALINPPEPPCPVQAYKGMVPRGVSLCVEPAQKRDGFINFEGDPGGVKFVPRITYMGGVYISWTLDCNYPQGANMGAYSTHAPGTVYVCRYVSTDGYSWKRTHRHPVDVPGQHAFDGFTYMIDSCGSDKPASCIARKY